MDEIFDPTVFDRGSTESIVESFAIVGLYGYRSISLSSPYAASVHIAKNGSGKTTLLAALNAVLKGQFTRLLDLEFSEIRCRIRGVGYDLVLERSQLTAFAEKLDETELARMARRLDLSPTVLLRFLVDDYPLLKTDFRERTDDPIFSAIMKSVSYRSAQAVALCDRLIEGMFDHVPSLRQLGATLRSVLKNVEIIYLPTFRRVELPLLTEKEGNYSRRRRPRFRFAGGSLFSGDIQFGLGDISDRLAELNQRILVDSNSGYRSISANIINELIDGTFDRASFDATELPSKEELTDAYSVENYLVSREVLREVLKVEFHCHGRPDIRESIVAGFDRAYSEFLAVTRNLNRRLFVGRRLGIIAGSTPDKLADVATVELEQVTASERAVEEIVPFAVEPDSAEVAILDGLFAELDAATRYRGKYALSFFERWLSLLADEYASSTSTTFGDIDRKEKVRRSEIVLGGLASKSSMPQQLSEFLAAVEPAVGQGA